jgi:NAD-dependent deacetylase
VNQPSIPPGLAERLNSSRHVMVLTGAGVSAESGVPTFRDAQTGLWSRFRPEQLATVEAFVADPDTVWAWYEWRRDLVEQVAPNAGHLALAELESLVPAMTLVTQNVDGLHRLAGSRKIIEFHGNLFDNHCLECARPAPNVPRPCPKPPRCLACGGLVRPGVVWFGEAIPALSLERAVQAADSCDLFMSIGTSALVHPAAGLAARARSAGAALVEINPEPTELARFADFAIQAPSGHVLPALRQALTECHRGSGRNQ